MQSLQELVANFFFKVFGVWEGKQGRVTPFTLWQFDSLVITDYNELNITSDLKSHCLVCPTWATIESR